MSSCWWNTNLWANINFQLCFVQQTRVLLQPNMSPKWVGFNAPHPSLSSACEAHRRAALCRAEIEMTEFEQISLTQNYANIYTPASHDNMAFASNAGTLYSVMYVWSSLSGFGFHSKIFQMSPMPCHAMPSDQRERGSRECNIAFICRRLNKFGLIRSG